MQLLCFLAHHSITHSLPESVIAGGDAGSLREQMEEGSRNPPGLYKEASMVSRLTADYYTCQHSTKDKMDTSPVRDLLSCAATNRAANMAREWWW